MNLPLGSRGMKAKRFDPGPCYLLVKSEVPNLILFTR